MVGKCEFQVKLDNPLSNDVLSSDYLSYSDKKIYLFFIEKLKLSTMEEVAIITDRFYESFYEKGKDVRMSAYNATLNIDIINNQRNVEELEEILTTY